MNGSGVLMNAIEEEPQYAIVGLKVGNLYL